MYNSAPSMDINVDLIMSSRSQMAGGNITNIGDANTQIAVLQERIKALELQVTEKNARIAELTKMNNYLMDKK